MVGVETVRDQKIERRADAGLLAPALIGRLVPAGYVRRSGTFVRALLCVASFLWVLLCGWEYAQAQTFYVRAGATGGNTGADWNNAYTSLPATLVRGATYYLANGFYGSRTFADPNSGAAVITIKKAIESAHGTNTGWTSAYGDGQAVFTWWLIPGDYYVFDGQRRNADWQLGRISEYGIRVYNPNGIPVRLDNGGSDFGNNLTFKYVDFEAPGRDYLGDSGGGVDVIYSNGWTGSGVGPQNVTFSKCAMHDSDRTIFLMRQWKNLLVEYSYIARNASSAAIHGEIVSDDGSDDVTFRFNVIEDPEGTAVFAILNGDPGKSTANTANNWQIYGNVIFHSMGYAREGIAGVVFSANDSSNSNWSDNWKVYNNTIAKIVGTWSGVVIQAGAGNIVQNNIWYKSVRTNNSGAAFDYNWYFNTVADGDGGANKQICTFSCSIFVDAEGGNFHLATATNSGKPLPTPYNMDMDGRIRGGSGVWARGAYEFGDGASPPAPPSNLAVR